MTLHAASRESLALAEETLGEVLGDPAPTRPPSETSCSPSSACWAGEIGLRRAVSDGSAEPDARKALFRSLLGDKVSDPTLLVLDAVASNRWSSPRELVDGIEALGRSALLSSAEKPAAWTPSRTSCSSCPYRGPVNRSSNGRCRTRRHRSTRSGT